MESKSNSIFKCNSWLSQNVPVPCMVFSDFFWSCLAWSQPLLCFPWTWIQYLQLFSGSFTAPWSSMLHSSEQYCLAWESKYLMELGSALDTLVNGFVNMMAQEALKFTVLSGKNLYYIGSVLVRFHCWCLFKGAFLIRENFWEGILVSPCKSGLRTFSATPVIQNCFPGLLCLCVTDLFF